MTIQLKEINNAVIQGFHDIGYLFTGTFLFFRPDGFITSLMRKLMGASSLMSMTH